jgi:hypothetical protein
MGRCSRSRHGTKGDEPRYYPIGLITGYIGERQQKQNNTYGKKATTRRQWRGSIRHNCTKCRLAMPSTVYWQSSPSHLGARFSKLDNILWGIALAPSDFSRRLIECNGVFWITRFSLPLSPGDLGRRLPEFDGVLWLAQTPPSPRHNGCGFAILNCICRLVIDDITLLFAPSNDRRRLAKLDGVLGVSKI